MHHAALTRPYAISALREYIADLLGNDADAGPMRLGGIQPVNAVPPYPDVHFVLDAETLTYAGYTEYTRGSLINPPDVFMGRTVHDVIPAAAAGTIADAIHRAHEMERAPYELNLGNVVIYGDVTLDGPHAIVRAYRAHETAPHWKALMQIGFLAATQLV